MVSCCVLLIKCVVCYCHVIYEVQNHTVQCHRWVWQTRFKPLKTNNTSFMFRMAPVLSLWNQEILNTITSFYKVTTWNRRECSNGSVLWNAFLKQYRRGRHVQYVRLVTTGQIVVFRLAPSTSEFRFFTFHHCNVSKLLLVAKTNQ